MRKNLISLLFLSLLISCKKETKYEPLSGKIIVDSIKYNGTGADLYYKVEVQGGAPSYNYNWITPSQNIGFGPFHINLIDIYNFETNITDSKQQSITLKYNYDYRDSIIGRYICKYSNTDYGSCSNITKSGIDTLVVVKSGTNEISVLSLSFKLDSTWRYGGLWQNKYHKSDFRFFPQNDSISIFLMDGGLGCGTYYSYNGKK